VGCDVSQSKYHIWFISTSNIKIFLGEDMLTEDRSQAIETDNMDFALSEMSDLLKNQDFIDELETYLLF